MYSSFRGRASEAIVAPTSHFHSRHAASSSPRAIPHIEECPVAKTKKPAAKKAKSTSSKKFSKPRKITIIDAAQLLASVKHHPGPGNGRNFAASRLPESFQTVIDPNKNPPQPFRALPPSTGKAPYRLSLDTVLSVQA